jgi:hypothetical protein
VADGTFFPLESIVSFELDRVIKHTTIFPGGFYGSAFGFFMNEERFNKLPKQGQGRDHVAVGEKLARFVARYWDNADRAALKVLKKSGGQMPRMRRPSWSRASGGPAQPCSSRSRVKAADAKGVDGARAMWPTSVRRSSAWPRATDDAARLRGHPPGPVSRSLAGLGASFGPQPAPTSAAMTDHSC